MAVAEDGIGPRAEPMRSKKLAETDRSVGAKVKRDGSRSRRKASQLGVAAMTVITLAACSPAGGRLNALRTLASTCPKNGKLAESVALDVANNQRSPSLTAARLATIRNAANQIAACGGHLRVVVFGATTAASATVYDGDLAPSGATLNARLLRVPRMVNNVVTQVDHQIQLVVPKIDGQGDDPLSALTAADQYVSELGTGFSVRFIIETDGISSQTLILNTRTLNADNAKALALRFEVPDLSGSSITFAGIGKVGAGSPLLSSFVEALRTGSSATSAGARTRRMRTSRSATSRRFRAHPDEEQEEEADHRQDVHPRGDVERDGRNDRQSRRRGSEACRRGAGGAGG